MTEATLQQQQRLMASFYLNYLFKELVCKYILEVLENTLKITFPWWFLRVFSQQLLNSSSSLGLESRIQLELTEIKYMSNERS